jgi:hypothetical protein
MKIKQLAVIVSLVMIAAFVAACDKGTNSNSNANSNSNSNANSNTKTAAADSPETSPIAAFKILYAATQKKDVENIKKGLSARTLVLVADIAKKQERTMDETLRENLTDPDYNSPTIPDTRNEKINGNEATIEVIAPKTGQWTELPFVKEEGRWKLAYDKLNQGDLATMDKDAPDQPGGAAASPSPTPPKYGGK